MLIELGNLFRLRKENKITQYMFELEIKELERQYYGRL